MVPALQASDDLLVARLVNRDPKAWEEFLIHYGGVIAGACRRALTQAGQRADEAAVGDASAEVIQALLAGDCRLLRRFRPESSLAAYLRVIARSRTLDALRRRIPSLSWLPPAAEGDPVDAAAQAAERATRLREALATLPPRDARLIRLFHLEGFGYPELAKRLGAPPGQVGMLLARARERLRTALGEDFLDSA